LGKIMKSFVYIFILIGLASCTSPNFNDCLTPSQQEITNLAQANFEQILREQFNVNSDADYKQYFETIASSNGIVIPQEYIISFEEFKTAGLLDTSSQITEFIKQKNEDNSTYTGIERTSRIDLSTNLISNIESLAYNDSSEIRIRTYFLNEVKRANNISTAIIADGMALGFDELDMSNDLLKFWILYQFYIEPCIKQSVNFQEVIRKDYLRPAKSNISKTSIDTSLLFNIWSVDSTGPHADFSINSKEFYIVDYDGDGAMPFFLSDSSIAVFYEDRVEHGSIIYLDPKQLTILWRNNEVSIDYILWEN
jgi:hypothetical protein